MTDTNSDACVRFEPRCTEPPADRPGVCRAVLVGPGHNQPEPYEGYGGFVGWSGVTRLRSGRWLVTFTSGLWHATLPWTEKIARDPACRKQFEEWAAIGLPDMPAPRGGRAHVMHSDDAGRTWSKPRTLVDTERDDRHPTVVELADSTLFCSWFGSRYPRVTNAYYMLSRDSGETWTRPLHPGGEPQEGSFGNGSAIRLADGTAYLVYLHTGGHRPEDARTESLFGLRVRVRDDAGGIDVLPAPGSPAATGKAGAGGEGVGDGGDPELGDRM